VVIGTPAREAMAEERRKTKTYPPKPNKSEQASINLTSGHSRHHPAEATESSEASLFDRRRKSRARSGQRTRIVVELEKNSRRKMESSASRDYIAEDGEQPQRMPVLGL
jgi:hypothetical protein